MEAQNTLVVFDPTALTAAEFPENAWNAMFWKAQRDAYPVLPPRNVDRSFRVLLLVYGEVDRRAT